jgi:hypothetical protein
LEPEFFENVKDQIGFCGVWCGSCVAGNGALRELTRRYDDIIKAYGLQEWGPKEFNFKEFKKGLRSIREMPLCEGCQKGDGKPNCEIRACASSKGINDCSQCDQSSDCKHSEALQKMREGALGAGLLVKTEDIDRRRLIMKWTRELRGKWPHSILFMPDEP